MEIRIPTKTPDQAVQHIEQVVIEKLKTLPRGRTKLVPLVRQETKAPQELIEATLDAMVQRGALVEKPKGKGTQFHIPDPADGAKPAEGAAQPEGKQAEEEAAPVAEVLAKELPADTPPSVPVIFEAARAATDSKRFLGERKARAAEELRDIRRQA